MAASKARGPGGVPQLVKLLDQAGLGGRGRLCSLSRWMRTHHDSFAAMLASRETRWDEVADALAAMGLRDGANQPPTAERARKVWWSVRRAKAAAAAKRQDAATSVALVAGEIAPAVSVAAATNQDAAYAPRQRLSLDIRPATPLPDAGARLVLPATPSPPELPDQAGSRGDARAAQTIPAGDSAAALQRLRQQIGATTLPLPKVVT